VPPAIRLTLLTARREQIDETQGRIRFFPDGTSTGGAVRLRREARAYEVAVDWFDGRVSIDESQAQ
jgi:general secretion pathway protein H